MPILAVCENPKCNRVYAVPSFINISDGATNIEIRRVKVGQCKACGSGIFMPDGVYSDATTFWVSNPRQWDAIVAAASALHLELQKNTSPEEAIAKTAERHPVLQYFAKLLPQNAKELAIWVGIIIAISTQLQGCKRGEKPSSGVGVNGEVIKALREIVESIPDDQHDSQPPLQE